MLVTKQNIIDLLYTAGLINNTDLQTSHALTTLVAGIVANSYNSTASVETDISNSTITGDTYIYYDLGSSEYVVNTASNIVKLYS